MIGSGQAVLITGAGGYLGTRIAKRYLEHAERPVILWLHSQNEGELAKKAGALRTNLGPVAESAIVCGGDLRSERPFAGVDPAQIGQIVHAAAVTRFNVERDLAEQVNVEGARKVCELASRCGGLEHFALLSSIYACGLTPGIIHEDSLPGGPEFANHYEWSKWESEQLLARDYAALPWTILRVATVVADDAHGTVVQYNAFHNTLKLLFYGLVSLIPGDRETPLYFVTADFATDAVLAVLNLTQPRGVYHVSHARDESMTLGQLIDLAFERFAADPDFSERRLLKPLFCDAASFQLLVDGVEGFGGDVVRQGLASIMPFAAQLFSDKRFDNRRLRGAFPSYEAPDALQLVRNACDYLTRTRWGTRLEHAA